MTLPSRPAVVTTDNENFQTMLRAAPIVEQLGLTGQLILDGANQAINNIPTLVNTKLAPELTGIRTATAGALASQVTSPAFISPDATLPRNPTTDELSANVNLYGSRLLASGARQSVVWNRTSVQWQDLGQPGATLTDINATQALATALQLALQLASLSDLTAYTGTATTLIVRGSGAGTYSRDDAATVDGVNVVAGSGGRRWRLLANQQQTYKPGANMVQVLARTEGHPTANYALGSGSSGLIVDALGVTSTDPSQHVRFWTHLSSLHEPWSSTNRQQHVAHNARSTSEKQGGYTGAQLLLSALNRTQITGIVTATNGSTTVTGDGSGQWLSQLKAPSTAYPSAIFLTGIDNTRATGSDGLPGIAVEIQSINGDNSLTLKTPWTGPTSSNYRIYRTVHPGPASNRSSLYTSEMDINNFTGYDVTGDNVEAFHLLYLVSGGDSRPGYAINIAAAAPGYSSNAPFYGGIQFKDEGIYDKGINFLNVSPRVGINFSDEYAGGVALSLKEGLGHGIEVRMTAGSPGYISGNAGQLELNGGVSGTVISNNARTAQLWNFEDNGNLTGRVSGKGVILRNATGYGLLRYTDAGQLSFSDVGSGSELLGAGSNTSSTPDPVGRFYGRSGTLVASNGTQIAGEPFIVWDSAVSKWRMFYFQNGQPNLVDTFTATATVLEGPWSAGTLVIANRAKLAVLVDEDGNPVQVGGLYHGYTVSFNGTNTGRDIYHCSASALAGPWTVDGSPVLARGATGSLDAANCEAPYALYRGGTVALWYMAQPDTADATYGLAHRVRYASAATPGGTFTKGGIVLNPSTVNSSWEYGWIGGVQIRRRPGGGYWMAYNAGNTRPSTAGTEPDGSNGGFAVAPDLTNGGTWIKDAANPYTAYTGIPSDALENTNVWRLFLVLDPQTNRWLMFYNTGKGGGTGERITFARQGVQDIQYGPQTGGNIQPLTVTLTALDGSRADLPPGRYRVRAQLNLMGDGNGSLPHLDVDTLLRVNGTLFRKTREYIGNYAYENRDTVLETIVTLVSRGTIDLAEQVAGGTPLAGSYARNLRMTIEQL